MLEEPGPWGTGPWILKEGVSTLSKRSPQVVLEANPNYWNPDRKPKVQRVVFDNVISKAEALDLVMDSTGKVDIVTELTADEAARVAQSRNARVVRSDPKTLLVGVFNQTTTGSPWSDVRLRKAVNLAVDRDAVVKNGASGYGTVIPAMIVPGAWASNPTLKPYAYDSAEARKLMKQAGMKRNTVTIVAGEGFKGVVEMIAANLEAVGLKVNPVYADAPKGDDWDIWLVWHFDWSPHWPAGVVYREFFGRDGGYRKTKKVDPGFEQRYAKLLATTDEAQQEKLTQDLDKYVYDRADLLFLYAPAKLYAVSKRVNFVPYKTTMLELAETSLAKEVASQR